MTSDHEPAFALARALDRSPELRGRVIMAVEMLGVQPSYSSGEVERRTALAFLLSGIIREQLQREATS